MSHAPDDHYDRVTGAWNYLLGEELHYGVFDDPSTPLEAATGELTRLMIEHARLDSGLAVLDVGCGTGAPACRLADEFDVHVTGITTSSEGVAAARARAASMGLADRTAFEVRDGMDNGFADESFDRIWVLESSHLMRRRDALIAECARVLRPGGRLVLCDILLQRDLPFEEVRRQREPLALLRAVFGDARMETPATYHALATENGLAVDAELDLTAATRPTFGAWKRNADLNHDQVAALIGEHDWQQFRDSCDVLERFWDEGVLGYGLMAAAKP